MTINQGSCKTLSVVKDLSSRLYAGEVDHHHNSPSPHPLSKVVIDLSSVQPDWLFIAQVERGRAQSSMEYCTLEIKRRPAPLPRNGVGGTGYSCDRRRFPRRG